MYHNQKSKTKDANDVSRLMVLISIPHKREAGHLIEICFAVGVEVACLPNDTVKVPSSNAASSLLKSVFCGILNARCEYSLSLIHI